MLSLCVSSLAFFARSIDVGRGRQATLQGTGPPVVFSTGLYGTMPTFLYNDLFSRMTKNVTLVRVDQALVSETALEGVVRALGVDKVGLMAHSRSRRRALDNKDVVPFAGDNHQQGGEQNVVVLNRWNHMTVCLSLGVVAAGAGSFVPAFGVLSGLVGGVSQTFLAFVLPPLMWAKQHQLRLRGSELNALACFGILPWKEKALVLCGLGLIGWTLQSTWAELGSGEL